MTRFAGQVKDELSQEGSMDIRQAKASDLDAVKEITHKTIAEIYPHYYPAGTVTFFIRHHSIESISADISEGCVHLIYDDEQKAVGTVTIKENEICRWFVLPKYQGRGYGRKLIDFAENEIGKAYDEIRVDASLSAKTIYLERGYKEAEYHCEDTYFGDHLCYDVMKKKIER